VSSGWVPDDFAPLMPPILLQPRDEDPLRGPVVLRELLNIYGLRSSADFSAITDGRDAAVEMFLHVFGDADAPALVAAVCGAYDAGAPQAISPSLAERFPMALAGGARLIAPGEEARIAALYRSLSAEQRRGASEAVIEVRERATPDGLLRLVRRADPETGDEGEEDLYQVVDGRLVVIPITDPAQTDPFRQRMPREAYRG